jgi:charged multivesicular body protein 7
MEVVKFKVPKEHISIITNEDRAIASLKSLITDLNLQSSQLSSQIRDLSDAARNAVKTRNRLSALRALRSRKVAEQALARKLDNLSQLEGIYDNIEQAVDQVAMIQAMKDSTRVLRGLHSKIGDDENVKNVMEELQTEMLKSDDITNAISEASPGASAVDDKAIEAELELLVQKDEEKHQEKEAQNIAERLAAVPPLGELSTTAESKPLNENLASKTTTSALPGEGDLLVAEGTESIAWICE